MDTAQTRSSVPTHRRGILSRWFRAETIIPILALGVIAGTATPFVTRADDDRHDVLALECARLQDAIWLYTERVGGSQNYDAFAEGWTPLVRAGYLATEPVNPVTGSSSIVRHASASGGWRFDPITRRVEACIVNPGTGRAGLLGAKTE